MLRRKAARSSYIIADRKQGDHGQDMGPKDMPLVSHFLRLGLTYLWLPPSNAIILQRQTNMVISDGDTQ